MGEKVYRTSSVSVGKSAYAAHSLRAFPNSVSPNIASLHRFLEPFVLNACVTWNKVKKNVHITLVSLIKKVSEILVGSVSGSNLAVVGNIIASIAERRLEAGIYPDSVAAQLFDIIKLFDYSVEVADTVTVGVVERFRMYLIKYCVIKLLCHKKLPSFQKYESLYI